MAATGKIRIIGGLFRRTAVPVPNVAHLRPTPDRVRESLFGWVEQLIGGARCLDLFAGSGALGIESASRGASQVLINEVNANAYRGIESLVDKLASSSDEPTRSAAQSIDVSKQDAVLLAKQLLRENRKFDLIFLDPPFQTGLLQAVEPFVTDLLAPGGAVYIESDQLITEYAGLRTVKNKKAGQVYYHLLNTTSDVEPA